MDIKPVMELLDWMESVSRNMEAINGRFTTVITNEEYDTLHKMYDAGRVTPFAAACGILALRDPKTYGGGVVS